jgi:hypothetical protein
MYQLKRLVAPLVGPSYARVSSHPDPNDTSGRPLLPSFGRHNFDDDAPASPTARSASRHQPIYRRLLLPIIVVIGLFAAVAAIAFFMGSPIPLAKDVVSAPKPDGPPAVDHPAADHPPSDGGLAVDRVAAARLSLEALFARQSQTLAQAAARYSLKTNRPPPPGFDAWFQFAKKHECLIDDYDQIQRDFEPFYQLAMDNPAHFKDMIDRGRALVCVIT